MYSLSKNSQEVLIAETLQPIKIQPNGYYVICPEEEKDGYNADGIIILNDQFDTIFSFSASQDILKISQLAREQAKQLSISTNTPPSAQLGKLSHGAEKWEPNKTYSQYDIFSYNGSLGYVKQPHTSQENQLPFTAGSESFYGVRPIPNEKGIYPYIPNMAVEVGQFVYDTEDKLTYECIQSTWELTSTPHNAPEFFKPINE